MVNTEIVLIIVETILFITNICLIVIMIWMTNKCKQDHFLLPPYDRGEAYPRPYDFVGYLPSVKAGNLF